MSTTTRTMGRKVVACTDGSSLVPVEWAARNLLQGPQDDLHILRAATTGSSAADEERDAAEIAIKAGVGRERIHWHVLSGADAGHKIVEFVEALGAFIVVVGNRGEGGVKRMMKSLLGPGSVSEYVMHHSKVPVAIVPLDGRPALQDWRRTCVAYDDSDQSRAVLAWLCREVLRRQDELHLITAEPYTPLATSLVQVLPSPGEGPDAGGSPTAASGGRSLQRLPSSVKRAEAVALRAADVAEQNGAQRKQLRAFVLPVGGSTNADIGKAIVKYAKEHQIDMVVLGSRGKGSKGLLGLGSVSEYVVKHAVCPVIVSKEAALAA